MLMMCWFYCIPFAKGLFYASAFIIALLAGFMLKRGMRQANLPLRQLAFIIFFFCIIKLLILDIYLLREDILCKTGVSCASWAGYILQSVAAIGAGLASYGLWQQYKKLIPNQRQNLKTPQQVKLHIWANASLGLVMLLILWLAIPWLSYLTVGHLQPFFIDFPWQVIALITLVVILGSFWRAEDCLWIYDPARRQERGAKHLQKISTPRDTLWLALSLYLITLIFGFASSAALAS